MSSSSSGSARSCGQPFRLPSSLKLRLCKALDSPPAKGLNDWRALAAGLRLERFTTYLSGQQSPTECILNLWEVQSASGHANPLGDLLSLLKAIGRRDVACMIEQEMASPWVWDTVEKPKVIVVHTNDCNLDSSVINEILFKHKILPCLVIRILLIAYLLSTRLI